MKTKITFFFTLLFTTITFTSLLAQVEITSRIYGEADSDGFGNSISYSADGTRIVIGTQFNNQNGFNSGHARVYELNNDEWVQIGDDLDGANAGDQFGFDVVLSADGNRFAVSAPFTDINANNTGLVKVYEINNGNIVQLGTDIIGLMEADGIGFALSMSENGNRIAIGAEFSFGGNGFTRIYDFENGDWTQVGKDIIGENQYDNAGKAIAMSADGNRIAIGAPGNDNDNGDDSGQVRVFDYDGSNWIQIGADIDGLNEFDRLGGAVSISADGNRLATGGEYNSLNGLESGQVMVFELQNGNWTQIGSTLNGTNAYERLGANVALSEDGSVLIATANGTTHVALGYVQVYKFIDGDWTQIGVDIKSEDQYDFFGRSITLTANGGKVAIGVAGGKNPDDLRTGYVTVYQLQTVSTKDLLKDKVQILPNPTAGSIEILGLEFESLRVIDPLGSILIQKDSPEKMLDLSKLTPGVYIIQLKAANQLIAKKIVKN